MFACAVRWPLALHETTGGSADGALGRPVPGRNIFSDFPLPLQVDDLPGPDVALFGDLNALPLAQEAKDFLGSLRVATAAPLLFSDFGDSGEALQRSTSGVSDSGHCIVLVGPSSTAPPSAEHLGKVASLRAYRLDVADPTSKAWLAALGFAVRQTTSFTWIGDAEIEQHRPVRRFRSGSLIAFEVSTPNGIPAQPAGRERHRPYNHRSGRGSRRELELVSCHVSATAQPGASFPTLEPSRRQPPPSSSLGVTADQTERLRMYASRPN